MGIGSQRHTVDPQASAGAQQRRRTGASGPAIDAAMAGNASNHAFSQSLRGGEVLNPQVRAEMEARFGESFADVRVHDDAQAHRGADALEAKAYTVGSNIAFGAHRYAPHGSEGKRLLSHELAHVVQQRRGGPPPALDASAPHEAAADHAAAAVVRGTGPVTVGGGTGVGVARDSKEKKKKKTPPQLAPKPVPKQTAKGGTTTIKDPGKAKGVLGEVTAPFELYSDPSWNVFAGGAESSSSRTSIARTTRYGDTGGIDFLAENRKTGRLVIGEQKATGGSTFENATATTENLEKNIAEAANKLRASIKSGRVHPDEVAHVNDTIERLEQTGRALADARKPGAKGGSLPEEVVFELTSVGGEGTKIGKGYIDLLAKKYGDNPEFMAHLLERTYIRNPKLAKAMGRDPAGKVGTSSDPHVVRATDKGVMTDAAKSELERRLARKTPKEWEREKLKEKKAREQEKNRAREEERKAKEQRRTEERAKAKAERDKVKAEAEKVAKETEQKKLEELKEAAKRSGKQQERTQVERRRVESEMRRQAKQAGKEARDKLLQEFRDASKAKQEAPKAKAPPKAKTPPKAETSTKAEQPAKAKGAPEPETTTEPPAGKDLTAPKETPKVAPKETGAPVVETAKPTAPIEIAPKGITPKTAVKGALGVAGGLAAVSGVKDIVKDVKAGNYGTAAIKTGVLGLSFVGEAAPPLFAAGVIMNYWGPRHKQIEEDSFQVGDAVEEGAKSIPLVGRSETARRVLGGLAAANQAVNESIAYTVMDMGSAIADGAETVAGLAEDAGSAIGGAAEDVWDWITD